MDGIVTNGIPLALVSTESPDTPISNSEVPAMKIDIDYQEPESDVRSEPVPVKVLDQMDATEHASTIPRAATPQNPGSIPISAPHGTPPPPPGELLEEVKVAEQAGDVEMEGDERQIAQNGYEAHQENGAVHAAAPEPEPVAHKEEEQDVKMEEDQLRYPSPNGRDMAVDTPGQSSLPPQSGQTSAAHSPTENGGEDGGPPTKRARVHSDADRASITHSATPPPDTADSTFTNGATPVAPLSRQQSRQPPSRQPSYQPHSRQASHQPPSAPVVGFTPTQFRFAASALRSLKKSKDSVHFQQPVDPVALGIPHYPTIITNPMDLSTVERKLNASNPQKPDPNPRNPRYYSVEDFTADVHLIFANSVAFNGLEHIVSQSGLKAQEAFDRTMKTFPSAQEQEKPSIQKRYTPPAPAPKKATTAPVRRPSTSNPTIRRSDHEPIGRPKREIHPPAPRDMPFDSAPKKGRKNRRIRDEVVQEQLRFCGKVLSDLNRKAHAEIATPFYYPVDWEALGIPQYPKIVKHPMDLHTMRSKLENNQYHLARQFWDDFKLMIRNCFSFNPAGSPVNIAGIELQRLFDEKWKSLPSMEESDYDEDDEDDEVGISEAERARAIADYENQIAELRNKINILKSQKPRPQPKKEKREKYVAPVASTSKPPPRPPKQAPPPKPKKMKKPQIPEDDTLSFEQKKDLSEAISTLDGSKLEKVIQIIHEGVPEIRDSTEEIELEIDLLPSSVLTKLYNFVLRPLKTTTKRSRVVKGTGTGGLKRKSMDEDVEAEKIRQLEERMALFDEGGNGGAPVSAGGPVAQGEEHSSDSSSGSDSSGSDSE